MKKTGAVSNASVRVMRSYDYCHFEIVLGMDEDIPLALNAVDEMRKEAMRLADKAVEQYKIARKDEDARYYSDSEVRRNKERVDEILNLPNKEWSPEQKAIVRAYQDACYRLEHRYDYEDDWDEDF